MFKQRRQKPNVIRKRGIKQEKWQDKKEGTNGKLSKFYCVTFNFQLSTVD